MKKISMLLLMLVLGGCATDPSVHARFLRLGHSELRGSALAAPIKKVYPFKDVAYCQFVWLVPNTVYFQDGFRKKWQQVGEKYIRKANCDDRGNFIVSDLPSEEWILVAFFKEDKKWWARARFVETRENNKDETFIVP